ncbi:MAG: phosphoadenosine phosphosulfate reductase family protein [Firmicutes bacterium]|nr:phosphoadenosine phosphosulfate reductase family protein [Bacillota bacterium]
MNYVCVSGGADSTALALLLWERGENFEMVFSDTGAELPEVYWLLPRLSRHIQKPLHVVSSGGFFEHLTAFNYMLPGPRIRWCTRVLKQEPQDRFFESREGVSVYVGIRADEPRRLHASGRNNQNFSYPLAEAGLGKQDVLRLCSRHGLLNPVYEWRSNVSCFCCFFQRKTDWLGLLKRYPALFRIAEEWERQSMQTSKKQKWSWNKGFKLQDLRQADERQIKLWPDPELEPCLMCTV